MRRGVPLVIACLLAIAGCGGTSKPSPKTAKRLEVAAQRCTRSDESEGCVLLTLPPPPQTFALAPSTAHGVDFGWSCPSHAGENFGASYLSPDRSKNWTRACVERWPHRVVVWESSATRALDGRGAGEADARAALGQARELGLPAGRPIFFAIDFDETPAQARAVAAYFQGVHDVLDSPGPVSFPGRAVPVGAYGGYWPVRRLFDAHLIAYGWQTYAWSGGLWDPRAKLRQVLNGATVDYDRATASDYGQWPYAAPAPPKPPAPPPAPACSKRCHQERALTSTRRALTQVREGLAKDGCEPPYRRRVCVRLGHLKEELSQRDRFFAKQLGVKP